MRDRDWLPALTGPVVTLKLNRDAGPVGRSVARGKIDVIAVGYFNRIRSCATRLSVCARNDTPLFVELIAWRMSLPVLKRLLGITTLTRVMWSAPTFTSGGSARLKRLASVRYFFKTGGRVLVSGNCLERSLMLYRLLSRAGANPTLVLGVRTGGSSVAAHAWIELDGAPFDEPDVSRYGRLVAFGRDGRRHEEAPLGTALEPPRRGRVA